MSNPPDEPKYLMELPGLDAVPWSSLEHAYGPADGPPQDLKYLVSTNADERAYALENLYVSILHQHDIGSATSAALPFLLQILANSTMPNREDVAELAAQISYGARLMTMEEYKKDWASTNHEYGESLVPMPNDDVIAYEIQNQQDVYHCLTARKELLEKLQADTNTEVAQAAKTIVANLEGSTESP